jgi:hypothetical protein
MKYVEAQRRGYPIGTRAPQKSPLARKVKSVRATLAKTGALVVLAAACSRTRSVEPVLRPDRILVTFPMQEGVEHEITDPSVLGRVQELVHADLDGWRDIGSYGKSPIAHDDLEVDAGGQRVGVAVGDSWLQREKWLKDIPEAREKELLALVGWTPRR